MLIVMADLRCGILLDVKTRARAVLATASGTHFVHDGFSDILYVLLPVWAQEFRLNLAQVGLIRTAYTAAMASFQIPAGLLAERWGERRLLAAGTALTACGFIAVGAWAGGFASLLILLLIAGLGSGVQHPLSSSLVSKAYETGARRAALGTYNFSGDLGKVAVPAAVAFAATVVGWRYAWRRMACSACWRRPPFWACWRGSRRRCRRRTGLWNPRRRARAGASGTRAASGP